MENKLFDNVNTPVKKPSEQLFEAIANAKSQHQGGSVVAYRNKLSAERQGIVNKNKNMEKAAELLLEKNASIWAGLAAGQILPNLGMMAAKSKFFGKRFGGHLANFTNGTTGGKAGGLVAGGATAWLPDVQIMQQMMNNTFRGNKQNIMGARRYKRYFQKYQDMSPEMREQFLKRDDSGDMIKRVLEETRAKGGKVGGVIDGMVKKNPNLYNQLTSSSYESRSAAAKELQKAYDGSGYLKNVIPEYIKRVDTKLGQNAAEVGKKRWGDRAMSYASLGTGVVSDPAGTSMSITKKFLGSETIKKIPVIGPASEKLQGWMAKKMLTDRANKLHGIADSGKKTWSTGAARPLIRKLDEAVIDPTTSEIKNFNYQLGAGNKKARDAGF